MSHLKERKEKNCLNCNAVIHGRYCSVCGQENLEPQEGVGHLISHFFNDITHFDGKFFSSLKYVLFKPGFLSEEYAAGRRVAYLNPVRMFIFTSAFFFLIFFAFFSHKESSGEVNKDKATPATSSKKVPVKRETSNFMISGGLLDDTTYQSRKQYDSLIDAGVVKDGFIMRFWHRRLLYLKSQYGTDEEALNRKLIENVKHNIPQIMFLSLPLFALFLKLIYIKRKKFYYVAHCIFAIHLYIFYYLAILTFNILDKLSDLPYLHWLDIMNGLLILSMIYYTYKAIRNFYGQSRFKTVIKLLLMTLWFFVIILALMIGLFFFSVFKI